MRLPWTTRQEILDYEACYINRQREDRRDLEEAVIGFKENVQSRGYLLPDELRQMGGNWLRTRSFSSNIDQNPSGVIERITGEAFGLADDWEKLLKLTEIKGIGKVVASAILHLYDEGDYPMLAKPALRTIGIEVDDVDYDEPFWREYINFSRAKAECYNVCMRTLDRALYVRGNPRGVCCDP